jgi:hypothetical protein
MNVMASRLLFAIFCATETARATVNYFREHTIQFRNSSKPACAKAN